MTTKLNWHKVGQKVTMNSSRAWNVLKGAARGDEPEYGSVYSINDICCVRGKIYFTLQEVRNVSLFDAASFSPVYPTIVDQLRYIDAPAPEQVRREAEVEVTA